MDRVCEVLNEYIQAGWNIQWQERRHGGYIFAVDVTIRAREYDIDRIWRRVRRIVNLE